jgi:hypothetical protein
MLEAVKIGFSWPAFFFSSIWALFCKLWLIGLGTIAASILLTRILESGTSGTSNELTFNLISIAVSVFFGMQGNAWRAADLHTRGFEEQALVDAKNKESAIAQFLNGNGSAS